MIIYESESHLNFIKIYSGNFLFIDLSDVCNCYKIFFCAAFLVTSPTVCAVIWWQQCIYLWTLHCTDKLAIASYVRAGILATLLVDAMKEKYLCTQNFHWNNSGVANIVMDIIAIPIQQSLQLLIHWIIATLALYNYMKCE